MHHPAPPAPVAGDPFRGTSAEERSALQVRLTCRINSQLPEKRHINPNQLPVYRKSKPKVERFPEEVLNEDEDVQMEKARVKEALTCQSCEEVRSPVNKSFS